ncbi:chitosanase (glycosyl hydrolase group 75) [Herbihabitans rhizosphaerae]|uniref:Chitosanase (Glycosyl hydrolase group 75) n=1 Tax=Herbihabitans rhizosphaerae TaxID=1872711 RepID=A0A4Q7KL41_9PSEU|nr:glycoside hydrolase family 75 protein [Herbihabitans rhizosphaerae]RZS36610.1 chitosanase (glycosyl hydrolase group 75) [Herbihabitans rhizosphaerae]
MRVGILAGAVALVAAIVPTAHAVAQPAPAQPARAADGPTAAELLAKTQNCKPISNGKYRTDADSSATIDVCDANGAVFWHSDMDIDCDGQRTDKCNENTDPSFYPDTAFHQSDGKPLVADTLPFVVLPGKSDIWDYAASGLKGSGSCVIVYGDKVLYGVVGDIGPKEIIGEASYAAAAALGIDPDPSTGGTDKGVTYICFKNSGVSPIEDQEKAKAVGAELATKFVQDNGKR